MDCAVQYVAEWGTHFGTSHNVAGVLNMDCAVQYVAEWGTHFGTSHNVAEWGTHFDRIAGVVPQLESASRVRYHFKVR